MRYDEGPTAEVEVRIDAPVDRVWVLVSDIGLPARFSTELREAVWIDAAPVLDASAVGARFVGRSQHPAIGQWETSCVLTTVEPGRSFGWAVGDAEHPSASWRFDLEPDGDAVRLRQWMQLGPAPSGLSPAIEAMPDKEERIIARRLDEHRANMAAVLAGIKALAEGEDDTAAGAPDAGVDAVTLRVGIMAMPFGAGALDFVLEAERLGVDSVWVPEFWAYDALTPVAFLAPQTTAVRLGTAIVQLGSRSPALLAMSAMSLQVLSGGRFVLGIGTSGPQVMEGWHGVRFDRPVQRTRETIEIIRSITAGERLAHDGELYQLPLPASQGRSIRSQAPPVTVPIYVAALGPANLRLTGELADGWIGNSFFPETADVFLDQIRAGAASAGRTLADLDLGVAVGLELTDDVEEAGRRHAHGYAFTFGAMGSATSNFYNDAFARQGYGDDVAEVQRLWLAGDRAAAEERVPIEIGLGTNLIGPPARVKERLRLYRDVGLSTLRVGLHGADAAAQLDGLGQLLELVAEVNAEPT